MASYQYGTSPRKLEPRYKTSKRKLEVIKNEPKKNQKNSKDAKKSKQSQLYLVIAIFALLVTISYRNSLINEEFNSMQNLKQELANVEKENKQLEIGIEGSLNLNNIEKIATEQLGMQKRSVDQTIYTELPKEDYVEAATEEIKEEKASWIEKILNIFK